MCISYSCSYFCLSHNGLGVCAVQLCLHKCRTQDNLKLSGWEYPRSIKSGLPRFYSDITCERLYHKVQMSCLYIYWLPSSASLNSPYPSLISGALKCQHKILWRKACMLSIKWFYTLLILHCALNSIVFLFLGEFPFEASVNMCFKEAPNWVKLMFPELNHDQLFHLFFWTCTYKISIVELHIYTRVVY